MIKKQLQKLVLYIVPKRIVIATGYPSGILLKASEIYGKKYLSIAVTNIRGGHAYIHHVPVAAVIGIKKSITPFKRWLCYMQNKPLPNYPIKPLKK
jgi:hypothetical protein